MINLFPHGTGEEGDETGEAYREMIRESNARIKESNMYNQYHDDLEDEGAEYLTYPKSNSVTCKYCGKTNLRWKKNNNGKYWLVENDDWHACPKIDELGSL